MGLRSAVGRCLLVCAVILLPPVVVTAQRPPSVPSSLLQKIPPWGLAAILFMKHKGPIVAPCLSLDKEQQDWDFLMCSPRSSSLGMVVDESATIPVQRPVVATRAMGLV
jgi:hypothetical protein